MNKSDQSFVVAKPNANRYYTSGYDYVQSYDILYGTRWTPYNHTALILTYEEAVNLSVKLTELDTYHSYTVRKYVGYLDSVYHTDEIGYDS